MTLHNIKQQRRRRRAMIVAKKRTLINHQCCHVPAAQLTDLLCDLRASRTFCVNQQMEVDHLPQALKSLRYIRSHLWWFIVVVVVVVGGGGGGGGGGGV